MSSNFAITLVLLVAIACLSQGCCPEGFMQVGDQCYYYNSEKVDWDVARHECEQLGAHLVSIHNSKDSRDVYVLWKSLVHESYINNVYKTFWIGLHDQPHESVFVWSDGTPMDYSLWYPGEPNNAEGEDCVVLVNHGSNDHDRQMWNDCDCFSRRPYFCRRSVMS